MPTPLTCSQSLTYQLTLSPQDPSQSFPSLNSPSYPRPTYLHTFSPHDLIFLTISITTISPHSSPSPPASLCFPQPSFSPNSFPSPHSLLSYLLTVVSSVFPLSTFSPHYFPSLSLFLFPLTTFPLKTSSSSPFLFTIAHSRTSFLCFPITAFLCQGFSITAFSPPSFPLDIFSMIVPLTAFFLKDSLCLLFSHFPLRPLRHTSSLIPYPYPVSP